MQRARWILLVLVALLWDCAQREPSTGSVGGAAGTSASGGTRAERDAGSIDAGVHGAAGAGNAGRSPTTVGGSGGTAVTDDDAGPRHQAAADGGGVSAASYMIGADITSVQAAEDNGATYSDGTKQDILPLLKSHGFNYIRLRTFVDPKATDGYDKQSGYADLAHTIRFGKRIKAAGLGFLLDFHYSDNWADPGKQCVPIAWQHFTTITELASAVHDYTKDAVTQLIAAGARPDMVQIGNEITSGMLMHVCDDNGRPRSNNPVSGSISNWSNLGALLQAGSQAVRGVDSSIEIMLHIDRGGDKGGYSGDALAISTSFILNAQKQGVMFDVFGESCYQTYQGDPASAANTQTDWMKTFAGLTGKFPSLRFVAAEYGPMQREINDVMFALPSHQGAGTFNWEPSEQGAWNTGHALFISTNNSITATTDLSLYDAMKVSYQSRL